MFGYRPFFFINYSGERCVSTKVFLKGQFLLEYKGELITQDEGFSREEEYDADLGSFLFFFKDGSKCFW